MKPKQLLSAIVLPSIAAFLLINGCDDMGSRESESVRLARVQSSYLTLDEARANIPDFQLRQDSIGALQNYREQWIREQILLQEANSLQLSQQPAVKQRLFRARKEILTNALKEAIITDYSDNISVTGQELLSYFEKNKEQLVLPERYVQFRHLETSSLSSARAARQELQQGVSWDEVAQKYSRNPAEKMRQSQTYAPESMVLRNVPVMKQYIATLDSGAVSPIQRANSLYQFVQLTGSRAKGSYFNPQWFAQELREWLLIEKQRKYYNSYVKNLYLNAEEDNEIDFYNVLSTDTTNSDQTDTNQPNE